MLFKFVFKINLVIHQKIVLKFFFKYFFKVFEQRPSAIEDFAKYASYLAPHKSELSFNQKTIEYYTTLFEVN